MGIIQKIRDVFRPAAAPATTKDAPTNTAEKAASDWNFGQGFRVNYNYGADTPIDRLLNSTAGLVPGCDPRAILPTIQSLNYIVPVYIAAQTGFISLLGHPVIVCKDEKFKELIEKTVWPKIALHGEKIDYMSETKGIEHVARAILSRAFTHGMGFWMAVDQDQQIAFDRKQKITGIRVCDPMRWDAQEYRPDYITWQYQREGNIFDIRRDRVAGVLNLPNRRMPEGVWNRPMAYEGLFLAEIWLKALIARSRKHVRDGAPATITTITGEHPEEADMNMMQANNKMLNENLAPVKAAFMDAIKHVNETGRAADIIITHGGPLSIDSHTYGEGQTWLTNFQDEVREYLRWIAVTTDFPIYRLVPTDGGGLNADNSKSQDDSAVQISVTIHQPAVAAELKAITDSICEREGIRIPTYTVEFEGGNFDNPKTVAEIEKIQAETHKVLIEAFDACAVSSGMDAARAFAALLGMEYMESAEPQPMPVQ